jgi:DNA-3-methyladenine glycosylase II
MNQKLDTWRGRLESGVAQIAAKDESLQPFTLLFPVPTFSPHTNHYQELVESIISQQLSVKAATTITKRFVDLFGGEFPTPDDILAKDFDELRSVGLSGQKASYIRDLAGHVKSGQLTFDDLDSMTNQEIITMLIAVKGIGEWTAHMFLIFSMGRLDVLAYGDLGVRNAAKALYELETMPDKETLVNLSNRNGWQGYESIACWYLWKSLDNEPIRN